MNHKVILWYRTSWAYALRRLPAVCLMLLIGCSALAFAQNAETSTDPSKPLNIRATQLLGFEGMPSNAGGTLSVQKDVLQFQKGQKPAAQVKIAFIQDVLLGEQSKQVGGVPMTLSKTAAPFGGGRVVSLFAHKKYDIVTLEYVDANGGFHGAIFQLDKGREQFSETNWSPRVDTLAATMMDPQNRVMWRSRMKASKQFSVFGLAVAILMLVIAAKCSAEPHASSSAQWSVQVDKVDSGDIDLSPSFQIAIYENLLKELGKAKQFKQVFRDGDHGATEVSDLLILKTTVEKYTAGSETRRAVTTVSGATKLTVRTVVLSRDDHTILVRTVDGNVRFMGNNLRATHNLARNVAKVIKQSPLPALSQPAPAQSGQASVDSANPN